MTDRQAIAATVVGRVQGVGYRFTVEAAARQLGLAGWVRNTADGSVEVWAQGASSALRRFVAVLEQGPRAAAVRSVDVRPMDPDPSLTGFDVRF